NGWAALTHAKRSLQFDPAEVDAWQFYSQTLAALGQFDEAIEVLEKLGEEGEPVQGELAGLQKRAGLLALLENDRPKALGHFVSAREAGLTGDALGSGAEMLLDEGHSAYLRAVDAWEAGSSDDTRAELETALLYDPGHVASHNLLAVLLFAENDPSAAANEWREVIVLAAERGVTLPDPVHEHLARALWQSGDREGARLTLQEYLLTTPNGEWATSTRELLELIPAD
ncbi:MAG: tetratricopeptide repeat protein, partial [Planctomycetota bacterium]